MNSIKEVLMRRDGLSAAEADERIEDAVSLLQQYLAEGRLADAENICEEEFGLEPDYIFDLM